MNYEEGTILYYLKKSEEFLKKHEIPNHRLESELLLAHLLEIPRIKLYSDFEKKLEQKTIETYRALIKKKASSYPTAYLLNQKHFFNDVFFVDERVLIPRPETEELVELVLNENGFPEKALSVLDLGTGSGCIAISLKKQNPNWDVFASDISKDALEVAQRNAENLLKDEPTPVSFLESDLFEEIPPNVKFDIIVSNPPYIPSSEKPLLSSEVLKEPTLALFVEDILEFHFLLLKQASQYLETNGKLYLETHPEFAQKILDLGISLEFSGKIHFDFSKKERFLVFHKKNLI